MNDKTHTPGSWQVEECNEPGIFNQSYAVTAKDSSPRSFEGERVVICRLPTGTGKFSQQYKDAKLIAAAPELLEALQQALNRMETAAKKTGFGFTMEINNARAAITKATT